MFQTDKTGPIKQELLTDKELLIEQGGRIGRVFQIDKELPIDRAISIGQVRNLVIKILPG